MLTFSEYYHQAFGKKIRKGQRSLVDLCAVVANAGGNEGNYGIRNDEYIDWRVWYFQKLSEKYMSEIENKLDEVVDFPPEDGRYISEEYFSVMLRKENSDNPTDWPEVKIFNKSNKKGEVFLKIPLWPPDLFGFLARIVQDSEAYTDPVFLDPDHSDYCFGVEYLQRVTASARNLKKGRLDENIRRIWISCLNNKDLDLTILKRVMHNDYKKVIEQIKNIMELMSIADQAAVGYGFFISNKKEENNANIIFNSNDSSDETEEIDSKSFGVDLVSEDYFVYMKAFELEKGIYEKRIIDGDRHALEKSVDKLKSYLFIREMPRSIAINVDRYYSPVLPKSSVPSVGCALRGYSHNLCIHGFSSISAEWHFNDISANEPSFFNALLIPYPYVIPHGAFRPVGADYENNTTEPIKNRMYDIDQIWFSSEEDEVVELASFCFHIIKEAQKRVGSISVVVLPELALPTEALNRFAVELSGRCPELEMVICGSLTKVEIGGREGVEPSQATTPSAEIRTASQNIATTFRVRDRKTVRKLSQAKHHRWKIDDGQIFQYGMARELASSTMWWENTAVSDRQVIFNLFRANASMSVLICEDLARFDPVHPIVQAVGPNLIVALLMDGPQMRERWPARYATVLGDDPGSSVLTLTSIGMIRRSTFNGLEELRKIGLWKEPDRGSQELILEPKTDAIALKLRLHEEECMTIDGRSDRRRTQRLRLEKSVCVTCDNPRLRQHFKCDG